MSIFTKRHYEWLARFAARHLDDRSASSMRDELHAENPSFNPDKFELAYWKHVTDQRETP